MANCKCGHSPFWHDQKGCLECPVPPVRYHWSRLAFSLAIKATLAVLVVVSIVTIVGMPVWGGILIGGLIGASPVPNVGRFVTFDPAEMCK